MAPWGPRGPCCPGGPWWEAEWLSISYTSLDMYSLSFSFSTINTFLVSDRCFFVHLWHGGDRLLRAGWFPLCVMCLDFNKDHLTSPFSGCIAWIFNSWRIPLSAAKGGTRAINQTGQNLLLVRCMQSPPRDIIASRGIQLDRLQRASTPRLSV